MPTILTLTPQVQARLEESVGAPGQWWSLQYEIRTAIAEACNDLMLMVGRPTQSVQVPVTLTANTVWQSVPSPFLLITDIYGTGGPLRKISLHDLDYMQSSWSSGWEADTDAAGPKRWAPIGFNLFAVHPAPLVPVVVTATAIAFPIQSAWPYTGAETIPFHDELMASLEAYASHYCRLKEMSGVELQQAMSEYADYLAAAARLTQIEDRRDPEIFSPVWGGASTLNSLVRR